MAQYDESAIKKTDADHHYDVMVLGGGMIGLAAFVLLARLGWKVALLDQNVQRAKVDSKSPPARVVALNHASVQVLQTAAAWDDIKNNDTCLGRFEKIKVFDSVGGACLGFDSADLARSELGFIISNAAISQGLYHQAQQICQETACRMYWGVTPTDLQSKVGQVTLSVAAGQSTEKKEHLLLSAKLMVAADGIHSWSRQQLGLDMVQRSYGQQALVAVIKHQLAHKNTAWQWFLAAGPLAFLPLADQHYSSIVWSQPATDAQNRQQISQEKFQQQLAEAMGYQLGRCQLKNSRACFPLHGQQLLTYAADGVVFIGDAAHRLHPLAGQGANVGLADVACLLRQLPYNANAANALPWRNMQAYARERQAKVQSIMQVMDGLHAGFTTNTAGWVGMRSYMMGLIDKNGWLKGEIMSRMSAE